MAGLAAQNSPSAAYPVVSQVGRRYGQAVDEEDLDAPYRRAIAHSHEFIGLDLDHARALAESLDLTLNIVEGGGWYLGVNVTGQITVHVRDGIIFGTS